MGVGVVNRTSNMDSRLSKLFANPNAWILELAKGVRIIEVGLYWLSVISACLFVAFLCMYTILWSIILFHVIVGCYVW